jgi:hypothetical protein
MAFGSTPSVIVMLNPAAIELASMGTTVGTMVVGSAPALSASL